MRGGAGGRVLTGAEQRVIPVENGDRLRPLGPVELRNKGAGLLQLLDVLPPDVRIRAARGGIYRNGLLVRFVAVANVAKEILLIWWRWSCLFGQGRVLRHCCAALRVLLLARHGAYLLEKFHTPCRLLLVQRFRARS